MEKLTAVQWLIHKLITENEVTLKGENYKLFELAKEMEREQIIDAYHNGYSDAIQAKPKQYDPQKYYNQTYKSEKL
jgi:hypothetical protein